MTAVFAAAFLVALAFWILLWNVIKISMDAFEERRPKFERNRR